MSNTLTQLDDTGNSTKHKINPPIQREETLNMTEKFEKNKETKESNNRKNYRRWEFLIRWPSERI
jgi:hypothetical protein